jgi:hypothetical protein
VRDLGVGEDPASPRVDGDDLTRTLGHLAPL